MTSKPPRTRLRVRPWTGITCSMVSLVGVLAWGQWGAWTPLLRSSSSLGEVERLVILERRPSLGPYSVVVRGSEVMGNRSASDLWGMLLQPGFDPARRDFDGDGAPDIVLVLFDPIEPFFGASSMGRIRVSPGADGRSLLDCRTGSPLTSVYWCEDQDGNGSHELLVVDGEVAYLLAHAGPQR